MPKLSIKQIYDLNTSVGFDQSDAVIMTAIVLAESGGDTTARNAAGTGVGLYQINPKAHGAEWNLKGQDPQASAKFAFQLYQGRGGKGSQNRFVDWEAFTNNKFMDHIIDVLMATGKPQGFDGVLDNLKDVGSAITSPVTDTAGAIQNTANTIAGIAKYPKAILDWISNRNNIFRVVKIAAGGAILLIGLNLVGRPVVEPIASGVTDTVVPVAKTAMKFVK